MRDSNRYCNSLVYQEEFGTIKVVLQIFNVYRKFQGNYEQFITLHHSSFCSFLDNYIILLCFTLFLALGRLNPG